MNILLNGEHRSFDNIKTLAELAAALNISGKIFVCEVNGIIVKKESHASFKISEGDKIEVVHFIGGG